jgi:hypothetical protein
LSLLSRFGDSHDELAGVVAGEEPVERVGRVLESVHHLDRVLDPPIGNPRASPDRLEEPVQIVQDDEPSMRPRCMMSAV